MSLDSASSSLPCQPFGMLLSLHSTPLVHRTQRAYNITPNAALIAHSTPYRQKFGIISHCQAGKYARVLSRLLALRMSFSACEVLEVVYIGYTHVKYLGLFCNDSFHIVIPASG